MCDVFMRMYKSSSIHVSVWWLVQKVEDEARWGSSDSAQFTVYNGMTHDPQNASVVE